VAEVTGPCSTLPGAGHSVPEDTMCDDHPLLPATHRVQGETDSFGSELHDMCDACFTEHKAEMVKYNAKIACGMCEWCKSEATDLRDRRDFEEGLYGRVYRVCGACVKVENARLQEEMNRYEDDFYEEDSGVDNDVLEDNLCHDERPPLDEVHVQSADTTLVKITYRQPKLSKLRLR
jgi:hypothetical protein